jgi:hypothetical protein
MCVSYFTLRWLAPTRRREALPSRPGSSRRAFQQNRSAAPQAAGIHFILMSKTQFGGSLLLGGRRRD